MRVAPGLPGEAFTPAQARRAGWTEDAIRHALRSGAWTRVRRGVYRTAGAVVDGHGTDHLRLVDAARAAAVGCPRAVVSHGSAAAVHGLPVLVAHDVACLTVPAGTALRRLADVHLHRAALGIRSVLDGNGVRVTTKARAVVDIAREDGVAAGLVTADAGLRDGVRLAELAAVVKSCAGWPGVRRAARVLELADGAAESPLESVSRLRIVESGLPIPRLQAVINDEFGRFLGRVDFLWDDFGVVGEADGIGKYAIRNDLVAEKRRQERLEQAGLRVVRWEWADLRRFDLVERRLRRAFELAAPPDARRWTVIGSADPRTHFAFGTGAR